MFLSNSNIIIIDVNRPIPASIGNFLILKGEVKVRIRLGCLKRSHIKEKLTNANTTKIPKTERLAIITILPSDKTTAAIVKIIIAKVATHGVLVFF